MSGESEEGGSEGGLKVPPHIKREASYQIPSLGLLSDSESEEYRSRSSGLEYEMVDDCESTLHEMACAPVALQSYIVDDLIPTSGSEEGGSPPPDASIALKDGELLSPTCSISTKGKWKRLTWPLLLFLILGIGFIVVARGHLLQLLNWLEHIPWWERFIVFIFLFTMVSFPFGFGYIILNMMSGYLYGFLRGQITVSVSVAVGFSVSFLVCRSWMRDYARSVIVSSNALQALMKVVEGPNGLRVIMLTRFTPIPFGLQNVLFAMTTIEYPHCLAASLIGLLPTQLLNTYLGSTVRNMQEVLGDRADGYLILSAQVIFSICLMFYVLRKARRELAKLTHQDVESGKLDTAVR